MHLPINPKTQSLWHNFDKFFGILLISFSISTFLLLSFRANLDLIDGRYSLFMDERITFDGVKLLLHSTNFFSFLDHLVDGGDHRYGRILWNISTLISYLPHFFWGDSGQIFATRMAQVLFLSSAYIILCFNFISSFCLRGLAILVLFSLPYSSYFASMPKPEPLQLLFLAIFLVLAKSSLYRFGSHWIFLGIAFGAKISTLTILPLFVLLGLFSQIKSDRSTIALSIPRPKSLTSSKFFRLLAVLIAGYQFFHGLRYFTDPNYLDLFKNLATKVPSLFAFIAPILPFLFASSSFLLGLVLLALPFISHYLYHNKLFRTQTILKTSSFFFAGFIFSVPIVFFKFPAGFLPWINETILNTTHGSDDLSVNILHWLNYCLDNYSSVPRLMVIVMVFFFACIFIASLFLFFLRIRSRSSPFHISESFRKCDFAILFLISASLFFPVIFSVNRLWGHYLHLGSVFLVLCVFSSIQYMCSLSFFHKSFISLVKLAFILFIILQVALGFYLFPAMASDMSDLSKRSTSLEHLDKLSEFGYVSNLLNSMVSSRDTPLQAYIGASLYIPPESDRLQIHEVFGFFDSWDAQPDIIILHESKSPLRPLLPSTSAQFDVLRSAKNLMNSHIVNIDGVCSSSPCYNKLPSTHGDLLILSKID